MATTTNYSWTTPDDTDLVKDGAAAIRTLGSSADTTVKDLNPGTTAGDIDYYTSSTAKARVAIGTAGQVLKVNGGGTAPEWATTADQTPLTTKGDLFTFDTADARLGVGANGTVLTANSSEATGLEWAAPATGGMTLLSTTSLSTATTTISSISGSYNQLAIEILDWYSSSAGSMSLRFNSDTSAGAYVYNINNYPVDAGSGVTRNTTCYSTTGVGLTESTTRAVDTNAATYITLQNYSESTVRKTFNFINGYQNNGTNQTLDSGSGWWNNVAAIDSISIITSAGTWSQGSVKIWGIK
jgi:trimeric autotransporter adhesin